MTSRTDPAAPRRRRPDIEGLRAVAVLAVLGYHAFPGKCPGGFVGVDVFFVISGYLISRIVLDDVALGRFRLAAFHAARIRRLFPALILVLLACCAAGWFCLLADEYRALGRHVAASAAFVQNLALWSEAGYFDASAETKPLLHLWSLGVEGQFYLLWPPLLCLALRRRMDARLVAVALAAASFLLAAHDVATAPAGAFYSPLARLWELLAGATLAAAGDARRLPGPARAALRELGSPIGLLLVLAACAGFGRTTPFPGPSALVPVLGAVLVIAAGDAGWCSRHVLASRPMVWVGAISYPLYLWHWVLLSGRHIVVGDLLDRRDRIGALALAFLLAALTHRFVERPLHRRPASRTLAGGLLAALAATGAVGLAIAADDGVPARFDRYPPQARQSLLRLARVWNRQGYPRPPGSDTDPVHGFLRVGTGTHDEVLFFGDSHARQYWNAVARLYGQRPALAAATATLFTTRAPRFPPRVDERVLDDPAIRTVVLSFYWSLKYGSPAVDRTARCCGSGRDGPQAPEDASASGDALGMDADDAALLAGIRALQGRGKRVVLLLDNPFGRELDPHATFTRSTTRFAFRPPPPLSRAEALARTEPVRSRLLRIAAATGASVIDPIDVLCAPGRCDALGADGEFLHMDYDHLSLAGADRMIPALAAVYRSYAGSAAP